MIDSATQQILEEASVIITITVEGDGVRTRRFFNVSRREIPTQVQVAVIADIVAEDARNALGGDAEVVDMLDVSSLAETEK